MLDLRVTGDEAIKLKLLQIRCIQIRDTLGLVRDQDTLLRAESLGTVDNAEVAVVGRRVVVLLDVQVHLVLLDRLPFVWQVAGVDARYKKATVFISARMAMSLRTLRRRVRLQGRAVLVLTALGVEGVEVVRVDDEVLCRCIYIGGDGLVAFLHYF